MKAELSLENDKSWPQKAASFNSSISAVEKLSFIREDNPFKSSHDTQNAFSGFKYSV